VGILVRSSPPLSLEEQIELSELLEASHSRSLVFARGVFAARATTALELDPTEWLPLIMGDDVSDKLALKRIMHLLMRDGQEVEADLGRGVAPTPESDDPDVVREFCRGYVELAHKDGSWTSSQRAFDLTLPLMVLSDYVSTASLATLAPRAAAEPDQYRRECTQALSSSVNALYAFFRDARALAEKNRAELARQKIGRNDLCPCGSQKKFKKCCG
jgi:uncharacterized protein YecA (UPF0149 family)